MNKNTKKIQKIIDELERLGKENDFRNLETAIAIWLRAGSLENFTDKDIQEINEIIYNWDDSLLTEELKNIIDRYEIV